VERRIRLTHDVRMDINTVPEPAGYEDPLTGLGGPDLWRRVLVAEVARTAKYRRPLSIAVVELDGLQDLWDAWGEDLGRHAVREAAGCLRRASRASDFCTRIAASRFGIVLTETGEDAAGRYVERVREAVRLSIPRHRGRSVPVRLGEPEGREAPDALVRRAEVRLIAELMREADPGAVCAATPRS
jgi:diguanylate cyclase (GGDEF)-like protein